MTPSISSKGMEELIYLLYKSTFDDNSQLAFLDELSRLTDTHNVAFLIQNFTDIHKSKFVSNSSAIEVNKIYSNLAGENIYLEAAEPYLTPGRVIRTNTVLSDREIKRSEFYDGFCLATDNYHSMGATIQVSHEMLVGLTFNRQQSRPFTIEDQQFVERLMPHLISSSRIKNLIGDAEYERDAAYSALDIQPFGVMIFGASSEIVFINRSLENMICSSQVFRLKNGGLSSNDRDLSKWLCKINKCNWGIANEPQCFQIRRGQEFYQFIVAPYELPNTGSLGRILLVRDLNSSDDMSIETLRSLYGLTRKEADVAQLLIQSLDVKAVAELMGLGESTIVTHKKSIFLKMSVNSQAQLARLGTQLETLVPKSFPSKAT